VIAYENALPCGAWRAALLASWLLVGCATSGGVGASSPAPAAVPTHLDEAAAAPARGVRVLTDLSGVALPPAPVDPARRAVLADATERARAALAEAPASETAYIWLGRRLAYEGRFPEALAVFDDGLLLHPDSARLLRHRGHRHITCREFALAVQDLERSSRLAWGLPDEPEPDGQPNAAGIPRSTLQSNIAYHLGLAYYLLGDMPAAAAAWERGLAFSRVNDDMLVATSWWLYLARRRSGDEAGALALLAPVRDTMDILENHAYHQLLLMAAGRRSPAQLRPSSMDTAESATLGNGVATWLLLEGRTTEAVALWREVLAGPWWTTFGHIAAEAELWRRGELPHS